MACRYDDSAAAVLLVYDNRLLAHVRPRLARPRLPTATGDVNDTK